MEDEYRFAFRPFSEIFERKERALKPLEEAAEVFGAWQNGSSIDLIDECVDVMQAVVNLIDAEEYTQEDIDSAIERCNERNRERGRF